MKNKIYWNKSSRARDPFSTSRSIRSEITEAANRASTRFGGREGVEYLWIHLARKECPDNPEQRPLELEAWLNIIDEAAAIGTSWAVIYVGGDLNAYPDVWELAQWAQETHEMRVAFHYTGATLSDEQIGALNKLDPSRTFLFVEQCHLDRFRATDSLRIGVVGATLPEHARGSNCTSPANIACVHTDGSMYCCGLVVGDEDYLMGDARSRPLVDVVHDEHLPHAVKGTEDYPIQGCDGCPSHLSHIVFEQLDQHIRG
jgi:hypothetical protein